MYSEQPNLTAWPFLWFVSLRYDNVPFYLTESYIISLFFFATDSDLQLSVHRGVCNLLQKYNLILLQHFLYIPAQVVSGLVLNGLIRFPH